ncbi:MAG: nucleotidyltransferase domain-containing protein [Patescibacteria group bacterium]
MEITKEQQNMAEEMVKKRGLEFAVVFGSRANGKARGNSDLDIGVLDPKTETYDRYGDLYNDFSKIFKGYNVDLRMIKGSEPVFLYNALCKGKFLAGNKQNFYNYKFFAYKNFVDSKPLFELKTKILQKQQEFLKQKIKYA